MHIGILLEHSDPGRGGAEAFARDLAERLVLHGHRATLVSRTGPFARPVASWPAALRPWRYARSFLPELRAQGAERILALAPVPGCEFFMPRNGIVAASIPFRLEPFPPLPRAIRRWNPARLLHFAALSWFERAAVAPPARVIAISPRVVEDLRRAHPHAAPPLLLRTGVDLDRFRPTGPRNRRAIRRALGIPEKPLLLFVGHNFALKGLGTAIRALPLVKEGVLAVVGRGRARPFAALARRLAVADRILWAKDDRHLRALYRAAHVLVHPTHYDTASRVVLEAMASGAPAITTARDGNADLVAAGGGVVLERPGDPAALAAAIGALLGAPRGPAMERARAVAELCPAGALLDRAVEALTCAF
jgi:UDP-glucose:(heptosyl)LPS alpha-1,3-glucosyltransferase